MEPQQQLLNVVVTQKKTRMITFLNRIQHGLEVIFTAYLMFKTNNIKEIMTFYELVFMAKKYIK